MRQHRTLFMLFLRQSAWKVLLLLLGMALLQTALFALLVPDPAHYSLESALLLTQKFLVVVLLAAWVLLAALLVSGGGKGAYTLDRLALPPKTILLWQSVYNILVYFLFWGVQALVLILLCRLYESQGGYVGPQTFYLACWQSDLFHTFLPMDEWPRWLRNIVLCLGMGIAAACSSAQLRHKGKPWAIFGLVGLSVPLALQPMGTLTSDILTVVLVAVVTAAALYNAFRLGKEDGQYEEVQT